MALAYSLYRCFYILIFLGFYIDLGSSDQNVKHSISTSKRWSNIAAYIEKTNLLRKQKFFFALDQLITHGKGKISVSCSDSLVAIQNGIRHQENWANKFYEASGLGASNIFNGGHVDFGDYDSCLATKVLTINNGKSIDFSGQYCNIKLAFPLPERDFFNQLSLNNTRYHDTKWEKQWLNKIGPYLYLNQVLTGSLCIPSTCSRNEFSLLLNDLYKSITKEDIIFAEKCDTETEKWKYPWEYAWTQFLSLSFIVFLIIFAMMSTLLNSIIKDGHFGQVLGSFNVIKNFQTLYKESTSQQSREIRYLHGLRALVFVFQLSGHTLFPIGWAPEFAGDFPTQMKKLSNYEAIVKNSSVALNAVSVLFFLGGFVSFYSWTTEMQKKKGNVNIFQFIVLRFLRTLPTIIGSLLFIFILPIASSGPLYKQSASKMSNICLQDWWIPIFNLNTYMNNPIDMCLPQTWYTSADFHLYIMSFWSLTLLHRNPKKAIKLIKILLMLGLILPYIEIYYRELPIFCNIFTENVPYVIEKCYHSFIFFPHYITPYFFGIYFAYLIQTNSLKLNFTEKQCQWGCLLSIVTLNIPTLIPAFWLEPDANKLAVYIFMTYHKLNYTLSIAFIIWVCHSGKGGVFAEFLSWKIMVPISRMLFSLNMSHFILEWFIIFRKRHVLVYSLSSMMYELLTPMVPSVIFGIFFFVIFEAPFMNLMKIMAKKNPKNE